MSLGSALQTVTRPRTSQPGTIARGRRLPTVSALGVLVLAGSAALQGQSLATSAHPGDARAWLVAAAVLGFAGVRLLERDVPAEQQSNCAVLRAEAQSIPRRRRLGGLLLISLGGLYSLIATALLVRRVSEATATWVWLLGIVAVVVGAIAMDDAPVTLPRRFNRWQMGELGLMLVVVGVAIWLRLPNLTTIPANVHGDEASIGIDARSIMAGTMPAVFATGWYNVPALSFALHAATMRVFGDNLFGLRMASAIEGVLSVVLLYLLARRLWGSRPALLAAAFMAVAAWHIHFSRTGFHYMQAPVATLLVLYFLVRGIQDRRVLDWMICGVAIGVCVEVYYAARLAPAIVVVYVGYRAVTERGFVKTHVLGVLAMVFGTVVFLAPMAAVFARDLGNFGARTAGVLVTNPENLQHELDGYHVGSLPQVLAVQAERTLEAFNIIGETSLQYGHPGPLFDFWTATLLAMGAIAILLRFGTARDFLLTSWVWLALILGSVLTTDAVFSPHLVVVIPALMLAPALMLERAWLGVTSLTGRVGTYLFGVPVALLLGLALQGNVHDYFDVQVVERQPASRFTVLSNYAASINATYRLYVIGRPDWTLEYDTPRFLIPNPDAVDVRNAALVLPLDHIPASKGVAFLVENGPDDYTQRIQVIQQTYPGGQEAIILERPGRPVFTSYLVENSALAAADPSASRD